MARDTVYYWPGYWANSSMITIFQSVGRLNMGAWACVRIHMQLVIFRNMYICYDYEGQLISECSQHYSFDNISLIMSTPCCDNPSVFPALVVLYSHIPSCPDIHRVWEYSRFTGDILMYDFAHLSYFDAFILPHFSTFPSIRITFLVPFKSLSRRL